MDIDPFILFIVVGAFVICIGAIVYPIARYAVRKESGWYDKEDR